MKKLSLLIVVFSLIMMSCNEHPEEIITQHELINYEFDGFKIGVIDNTLVFDSENDLEKFIDYLVELGVDNYDEFEESIGYNSLRRSGVSLDGFDDPILKTLINPEYKNIICGYLLVSDFNIQMTTIYKLDDDLKQQTLDDSNKLIFSFDDDFFEFLEYGYLEKSIKSFCAGRIDTDNDDFEVPGYAEAGIEVRTTATYNRSFFYCYLQIEYSVTAEKNVNSFMMSYATTNDCFYRNNRKEDDFQRSQETPWIYPNNLTETYKFDRKPYNSHRRLTDYILNVDYVLHVSGYEGYPNGIRTINYQTYNSCGDS